MLSNENLLLKLKILLCSITLSSLGCASFAEDPEDNYSPHEYEYVQTSCRLTEAPFYRFEILQLPDTEAYLINFMVPQVRRAVLITVYEADSTTKIEEINGVGVFFGGGVSFKNDPNKDQPASSLNLNIKYNVPEPLGENRIVIK